MLACNHTSCSIYQVKPRMIYVYEAPAPESVILRWSSWTSSHATGTGIYTEYIQGRGTSRVHIKVAAYDVTRGHFSRLKLTFQGSYHHTVTFEPGKDQSGSPAWAPVPGD